MVSYIQNNHEKFCQLMICANQSMTWQQNLYFLYATYAVTFIITTICFLMGFWLVLPFAGIEMFALTYCLYWVARRSQSYEIITIEENSITIQIYTSKNQFKQQIFPRYWAKITLQPPTHRTDISHLFISAYGKHVEIAKDLIEAERIQLARTLTDLLTYRATSNLSLPAPHYL